MNVMSHSCRRACFLFAILIAPLLAVAQDDGDPFNWTMGPRYKVVWNAVPPEVYWDDAPAPEQLTVTSPGIGVMADERGGAQLLLDWRDGRTRLVDRAYAGEEFFTWALERVRTGGSFDPDEYRSRGRADIATDRVDENPESETWAGERVVHLSNPGHELHFVITPAGATATDNGEPVAVTGGDGNYRVYAEDYECGVSVQADGYVYHYYKPL